MSASHNHHGIVYWFIKNPVAANLLMVAILFLGLVSLFNIKLESFPPYPPKAITVDIAYPGSTPEEVEKNILIKVENALSSVEGIRLIQSKADSGGASFLIEKKQFQDIDVLFEKVKEKVLAISDLPKKSSPPVILKEIDERSIVWVSVSSDVAEEALLQHARSLREKLLRKENISNVEISGYEKKELAIFLSREKLQQYGLIFSDVATILRENNYEASVGSLNTSDNKDILMSLRWQGSHKKGLENILIAIDGDHGRLYLRDIARIDADYSKKFNLSLHNDKPAVLLKIKAEGKADLFTAYKEAQATINKFEATLPSSIHFELWHDNTREITDRLSFFVESGLFSMFLVFFVLAVFLNLKLAFWVAVGIPVSFAGALIVMPMAWFDLSLNTVTLFAFVMVLGIVVDDAIIVGESIYTKKQQCQSGGTESATLLGVKSIAIPATFGVLTTIAAFWPLTRISSEMGQAFGQLGWIIVFCLTFSLVESKLILPFHLKNIKVDPQKEKPSGWQAFQNKMHELLERVATEVYQPLLIKALQYRYFSLIFFIFILVSSVGFVYSGNLKSIFFPELDQEFLEAKFDVGDDMSLADISKVSKYISGELRRLSDDLVADKKEDKPPIESIYVSANKNSISIVGELQSVNYRNMSGNAISNLWRDRVGEIDGLSSSSFEADNDDMYIDIYGKNIKEMQAASIELKQRLERYKQVNQIKTSQSNNIEVLKISLTDEGRARGFTNKKLSDQIKSAFHGEQVKKVYIDGQELGVTLYLDSSLQRKIDDLKSFIVKGDDGIKLMISSIADIQFEEQLKSIERHNGERVEWISVGIDKSLYSANEVIDELEDSGFLDDLRRRYPSVRFSFGGELDEENAAIGSLIVAFSASVLLIYILLAIPLKSYLKPLLIVSVVPFGFIGVVIGHLIIGIPVSLLSFFGFLALCGVVVNDSLILITTIYEDPDNRSIEEAVKSSVFKRFRAVILTSLTTFVCLIPIIFSTDYQAQLFVPTAVSLGFGIVFSTLITLILVPVVCLIADEIKGAISSKKVA